MNDFSTKDVTITRARGKWVVYATGALYGESSNALEVQENGFAPVIYFPREDIAMAFFDRTDYSTHSPALGDATYYSIDTKSRILGNVAWSYENPNPQGESIRNYIAFWGDNVTVEQH